MFEISAEGNENTTNNIGSNRTKGCSDQADSSATDSSAIMDDVLLAAARNGDALAFGELLERTKGAASGDQ